MVNSPRAHYKVAEATIELVPLLRENLDRDSIVYSARIGTFFARIVREEYFLS